MALLSTANIRLKGVNKKLGPRWIGPYRVKGISGTAVELELPPELKGIFPKFHSSLVRRYQGTPREPEPVEVDGEEEWEIERIVTHRRSRNRIEYLVKWLNFDEGSNMWLNEKDL